LSKEKNMSICKLCLQDKELIKKSHIIPRFINKVLFDDDKNRFYVVHKIPEKGIDKAKLEHDWGYESELLCGDCENLIGKLETCASNILVNKCLPDSMALYIKHIYLPDGKFFQV